MLPLVARSWAICCLPRHRVGLTCGAGDGVFPPGRLLAASTDHHIGGRLGYLFSFFGIIDLMTIAPYWIQQSLALADVPVNASAFRVFRIFRILQVSPAQHAT